VRVGLERYKNISMRAVEEIGMVKLSVGLRPSYKVSRLLNPTNQTWAQGNILVTNGMLSNPTSNEFPSDSDVFKAVGVHIRADSLDPVNENAHGAGRLRLSAGKMRLYDYFRDWYFPGVTGDGGAGCRYRRFGSFPDPSATTNRWANIQGAEKCFVMVTESMRVTVPAGKKIQVPADQVAMSNINTETLPLTYGAGNQDIKLVISIPATVKLGKLAKQILPTASAGAIANADQTVGSDTWTSVYSTSISRETPNSLRWGTFGIDYTDTDGFITDALGAVDTEFSDGRDTVENTIDEIYSSPDSQLTVDVQTASALSEEGEFTIIGYVYINEPTLSGTINTNDWHYSIPYVPPSTRVDFWNWDIVDA